MMIIIIKNIGDVSDDSNNKLRALENLFCAYGEGRHVLWMPIELVSSLMSESRFSEFSKRVLYDLKSTVLETRRIESSFGFHVEIDFVNPYRLESDQGVLNIGYRKVVQSGMLQKAIFLTENLLDAQVYFVGAEVFLVKNRMLAGCQINLDLQPGGGSTTYDLFVKLKAEEKLFLCVIDSDKEHPRGPAGSTAKRFNGEEKGLLGGYYLEVLSHHEIENLLPIKIVKEVLSSDFDMGAIFGRVDFEDYRKFPDHKLGLKLSRAREMDLLHKYSFWKDFYELDDEQWLCSPMGDALLENVYGYMRQQSTHKLAELFESGVVPEWEHLSKMVASWGVGMRRSLV